MPVKMIALLGGTGRLPSLSELTQTPVLLQAVLPWLFVWKLYGIKDVRISKQRVREKLYLLYGLFLPCESRCYNAMNLFW